MPKATVDEQRDASLRKDKTGLTRQVLALKSEAKPMSMSYLPHAELGRRVLSSDARY